MPLYSADNVTVKMPRPDTGTLTTVASVVTSVTILVANPLRDGAVVFNDSSKTLYLLLAAGTASATNRSVEIPSRGIYEVPDGYTGIIVGAWQAANGQAKVTEFTTA